MENKNTLQYSIEAEPIDPLDPLQYDQEVHNIQQQETEVPVAEPLLNIVNGDTAAKDEQEGGTFCKLLKTRRTRIFVLLSAIFLTTTIVTVVALFINNNNGEDNDQPSPNPSMSPIETSQAPSNKSSSKWKDDYNPNLTESISAFFSESDTQGSAKGAIYGMLSRGSQSASMQLKYHNDVIANDHYWTAYFSDENNGSQQTCGGDNPLVSQIQCKSGHDRCDTLRLRCSKVKDNYKVISSSMENSAWFSDETPNFTNCANGYYLNGLGCSGQNCDNMRLKCVKVQYRVETPLLSSSPTATLSFRPSTSPTETASLHPSIRSSSSPSTSPTERPSNHPSIWPSSSPSTSPTERPSNHPSIWPSTSPTKTPSLRPSMTVWNDGRNPNLSANISPYFWQGQVSAEGAIYGMESNGEQSSKIRLKYHNDVITNDHYWTTSFSDENNGSQQTCDDDYPLVSQIECSPSHTRCDTLSLRCSKVKDNYKVIVSSKKDRAWFSDEQADFAYCPGGYQYLYGLGCSGQNCDNIQMKCVKVQYSS